MDNFISPNSGSKLTLSLEVAPPIKGFSEFYKIKSEFQHHIPVAGKLVLTSQADYGFIGYLTKNNRSNFQRFLIGGTQLQQRQSFLYDNIDLRGYPGGLSEALLLSLMVKKLVDDYILNILWNYAIQQLVQSNYN